MIRSHLMITCNSVAMPCCWCLQVLRGLRYWHCLLAVRGLLGEESTFACFATNNAPRRCPSARRLTAFVSKDGGEGEKINVNDLRCSRIEDLLAFIGAAGMAVSLWEIHIYVSPLKRFVQACLHSRRL